MKVARSLRRPRCVRPSVSRVVLTVLAVLAVAACQDSGEKLEEHRARGETYLEEEQFSEAILEYKNVLQIDPNDPDAHWGLAKAYLGSKQLRQAYWELQETVRLDAANVKAKIQYGQFLLFGKEEDVENAVAQAEDVLAIEPENWSAWVLKGRGLEQLKRNDEALAAYQKAVEVAPEEGGPLLLLANFLRVQGDREAAEPHYRQLTELKPGLGSYAALGGFLAADRERDAEAEDAYRKGLEFAEEDKRAAAYSVLANFLFARERYDEAEAVLVEALEEEQGNLDIIYALARFYNSQGRVDEADATIARATEADPDDPRPYLVLSSYRGRKGDLEGALEAAEDALKADPEDMTAKLRKAELLIDLGFRQDDAPRLAEGRAIVAAVLSADPASPEGLMVKAKIDIADGNLEEAVTALRRCLDGRPDWAQAHFLLGSALFLQRDVNGARAEIVRTLELDADLIDAQRILARIHAGFGEHDLAIEVGRRVLRRDPNDHKLRILVAQALVRSGRLDEAIAELRAIPEGQRDAEALYALGRVAYLQGDSAAARQYYESAYEADPTRYEVLRALLDLDMRENRLAESADRIRSAAGSAPEDSRIAGLQGEVALYTGNPAEAESSFNRAIELNPNDLTAYENLARYLMVTGRPREVLSTYEKALKENPNNGTLHLVVGSLYELQGRTEGAIERYEEAVRLDPNLAVAKNNLAYLLAESGGNLDRALDLAQEAKEQLPENPNAADTLGWVLYKKGVPTAAIGYLKEAERGVTPDNPQLGIIRHHLALAYVANEEPEEAREVLVRALRDLEAIQARSEKASPEPVWAGELRAMLEELGGAPGELAQEEG